MNQPLPGKGIILNKMSAFWFNKLNTVVPNHFLSLACETASVKDVVNKDIINRSMLVKCTEPIKMECIVRGYLAGSAMSEYKSTQTLAGTALPSDLAYGSKFEKPIFTPSTKASHGHDVPLLPAQGKALVGNKLYEELEEISIQLFKEASRHAENSGMILADTKFEFGLHNSKLMLIDELLTPDSSRFWRYSDWLSGNGLYTSFDKQYLRDWLNKQNWKKEPPPPELTEEVVIQTIKRYNYVYNKIVGLEAVQQ